jgi:glycosyltransferase involved in cell wall biosynthesis
MRILFGCEFYSPSVGGVQEVMRQLAERLVLRGHDVTVATTELPGRLSNTLNGVKVREFRISGNLTCGIKGKVAEYRRFVTSQAFDLILIKAAQQWTFDALWPVVSNIRAKKIFIPCGFSCLHEPAYAEYFDLLPRILDQFDHLIFYASDYRDINFARSHSIQKYSIIPNGASEIEFAAELDVSFRQQYGIALDDLLFLTVGSLGRVKGHLDVAEAFLAADLVGQRATLILNGNEGGCVATQSALQVVAGKAREYSRVINDICRTEGIPSASKHVVHGVLNKASIRLGKYAARNSPHIVTFREELKQVVENIHSQGGVKRVLLSNFPRSELVQAYMNADLFVFASHVEYSPLVLFESVAAGTPFLSVPVGNAEEIAYWTGAGVICPALQDEKGYTLPDSKVLAEYMSRLTNDRDHLEQMGALGKKNWRARFAWDHICDQYEKLFFAVTSKV